MMVNNVKKADILSKNIFQNSKMLKAGKFMRMVETLTKDLISSVTRVGVLQLLDLLAIF